MAQQDFPGWHGTTIIGVKKGGEVVIAGDGQVSLGQTVIKGTARKVRRLAPPPARHLVNDKLRVAQDQGVRDPPLRQRLQSGEHGRALIRRQRSLGIAAGLAHDGQPQVRLGIAAPRSSSSV